MRLLFAFVALLRPAAPLSLAGSPIAARARWPPRAGLASMAAPTFIFEVDPNGDRLRFGCEQRTVTPVKPEGAGAAEYSLAAFVSDDPEGIMFSSWPPGRVRAADDGTGEFLIDVEEFQFATLKVAVELRATVWLEKGAAKFESRGFSVRGLESVISADALDVRVRGTMRPSPPTSSLCILTGDVAFEASGAVPALLRAVPEPALRAASQAVGEALVGAAADRFGKLVPAAYAKWARARV